MASEKCLRPHEWPILEGYQKDQDRSVSRIFDELQLRRCNMGLPALGRKWFIKDFCHTVCCASNGKIGSRFRLPENRNRYTFGIQVEESVSVENVEPRAIEVVEQKEEVESLSDLLTEDHDRVDVKSRIIFCLRWLKQHGATDTFRDFYTIGGYKKTIAEITAKRLHSLGLIKKANKKRYAEFDWLKISEAFPEIDVPDENEHAEWKQTAKKSKQEVKSTPVIPVEKPRKPTMSDKMRDWLFNSEHAQNQITLSEIVNQLRIFGDKEGYLNGKNFLNDWLDKGIVKRVYGTEAYEIVGEGLGSIRNIIEKRVDATEELKRAMGLTPQKRPQESKPLQQLNFQTGMFVIRLAGKEFEIRNNSNSKVSLTIENQRVILVIQ